MFALVLFLSADVGFATPPEGFVDLRTAVPGIQLEIRYHTADNFTGAPLPGYGVAGAWMKKEAAEALRRVQAEVEQVGLSLHVYDAYRPVRGTSAMAAWAKRTQQERLFKEGYIAHKSGHHHGHTIDLTLADSKTGAVLDMGTPWDTLTPESNTEKASGLALANRHKLKALMQAQGFKAYSKEWWHFGFPMTGTVPRDVPYACFEAPEGRFVPPAHWQEPGFLMPKTIDVRHCR